MRDKYIHAKIYCSHYESTCFLLDAIRIVIFQISVYCSIGNSRNKDLIKGNEILISGRCMVVFFSDCDS